MSSSMSTRRLSNHETPVAEVTTATTKPSRKRAPKSLPERPTSAAPLAPQSQEAESDVSSSISTVHEDGACCLCHCALDYSDLAAFDPEARAEDYSDSEKDDDDTSEYVFRKTDPFLPKEQLYHPQNALVYCDTCHRWFHQACHFIPIFVVPPGTFTCLICQYEEKQQPKPRKKPVAKKKTKPLPSITYPLSTMFQSPPVSGMQSHEKAWECDPVVIALKVSGWHDQLHHRLERKIHASLQKYRRSQRTLETLLVQSSQRTRQLHLGTTTSPRRLSQELVQCLVAYTSAKVTLRHTMAALEWVRQLAGQRAAWWALQSWIAAASHQEDFVQRILFPFGAQYPRRWHPVTSEYTDPIPTVLPIPEEVQISHRVGSSSNGDVRMLRSTRSSRRTTVPTKDTSKKKTKKPTTKVPPAAKARVKPTPANVDDDDSGISLDQLQCCICLSGDCTDDNDLLLCDGAHCHRAYHMACLPGGPQLDAAQYEALEDWFCPLCQAQAEYLYQIQRHVQRLRHDDDDAWERRRGFRTAGDADSLQSWDQVQDVFPEAEAEYDLVQKLHRRRGVCDAETELRRLLTPIVGPDILGGETDPPHPDADDDEEDDPFDPRRVDTDDSSSSAASLADLSSVELHVAAEEVVALSKEEAETHSVRRSPRRGSLRLSPRRGSRRRDPIDPGQMDVNNILPGKRPRRRIDYRQLNDALFGQLSERELREWDA